MILRTPSAMLLMLRFQGRSPSSPPVLLLPKLATQELILVGHLWLRASFIICILGRPVSIVKLLCLSFGGSIALSTENHRCPPCAGLRSRFFGLQRNAVPTSNPYLTQCHLPACLPVCPPVHRPVCPLACLPS